MRRVCRAVCCAGVCAVALFLVALSTTPAAGQDDRAPAAGNDATAGSDAVVGNQTVTALPSPDDGGSVPRGLPSGGQASLASAVYPGLGQLLNKKEHKAAIIGGIEAFLIARLILEDRWVRNTFRLYQETGDDEYFDRYSKHFDTRQNLLWWAILVGIYGIADAYVDAHLAAFDEPLSPRLEGSLAEAGGGGPDGFQLAVVVRF